MQRKVSPPTIHTPPTIERMRHGRMVFPTEKGGRHRPFMDDAQTPLDSYRLDGVITVRQHAAGSQFQKIYFLAHGSDSKTQSWEAPISGSSRDEYGDIRLSAQIQLDNCRRALNTLAYSVLASVCGHGMVHSAWARSVGEHSTAGRLALRMALTDYANFLGMPDED